MVVTVLAAQTEAVARAEVAGQLEVVVQQVVNGLRPIKVRTGEQLPLAYKVIFIQRVGEQAVHLLAH